MSNNAVRSSVFAMSFLSSDDRVRDDVRHVLAKSGAARDLPFVTPVGTKLSAANFTPRRAKKLREQIADLNTYFSDAAGAGSPFIAFPELTGLVFMGCLPRAAKVLDAVREEISDPEGRKAAMAELVSQTQGCLSEIFLNAFSELARGHRMLVAAGGIYVVQGGEVKNRQYLFSETGEVLLAQDKLILSPFERELGVSPSHRVETADTRIGRMALFTASCSKHYEPFAVASALGCRIAVAGASPFGDDTALLRCRAQEQGLCVVSPGLSGGEDFALRFAAAPVVYAPRSTVRVRDGVAAAGGKGLTTTARVDLSGEAAIEHGIADKNPEFFSRLLF